MVKRFTWLEVLESLKAKIQKGRIIIDAFAGRGISAKFAEVGGADMVTTHILGRFLMADLSSMAGYLSIADANGVTLELRKRDIIPVFKILLSWHDFLDADPTRNMATFLDEIVVAGFFRNTELSHFCAHRWKL